MTMADGVRLSRKSLMSQLVSVIQHELITGEHAPGSAFVEEDVSRRYNVSRSTTREALGRLEEEGYLRRDAGTRILRFRVPSTSEIADVYKARRFYEGAGVNHAKHATSEQLAEIRASSEHLVDVLSNGEAFDVVAAEWRCHTAIVACIGSPLIVKQYQSLLRTLSLALAQIENPAEDMASGRDHITFSELLLSGQYHTAKKLLFVHLAAGENELNEHAR